MDLLPEEREGDRGRGVGMDDCTVRCLPVHVPVDPVFAGSTFRQITVQRDQYRFGRCIQVRTAPLDIKAVSFPYADIAEIPAHEMFGKESFSYPLEFSRKHGLDGLP